MVTQQAYLATWLLWDRLDLQTKQLIHNSMQAEALKWWMQVQADPEVGDEISFGTRWKSLIVLYYSMFQEAAWRAPAIWCIERPPDLHPEKGKWPDFTWPHGQYLEVMAMNETLHELYWQIGGLNPDGIVFYPGKEELGRLLFSCIDEANRWVWDPGIHQCDMESLAEWCQRFPSPDCLRCPRFSSPNAEGDKWVYDPNGVTPRFTSVALWPWLVQPGYERWQGMFFDEWLPYREDHPGHHKALLRWLFNANTALWLLLQAPPQLGKAEVGYKLYLPLVVK